jgi:cell division protein FtsN
VKGKRVYYRVRVGAFADKYGADATLNRLKKENYKPILILK